jgi:protein-S-isoprenylcysteine O-methyltransferase Ste14
MVARSDRPTGHNSYSKITLATFTAVSSIAYLGLAILGWGGLAPFFSHPALIALTVAACLMFAVAPFSGANLSSGEREDRSNRWVLHVFGVYGLLNAWLPAYADRHDILTIDGDSVRWTGVVLFTAGGALRMWPLFVLGHWFSGLVAIQPGHQLVTTGIYSVLRHPSYAGLLVIAFGWALAFRSAVGVLLTACMLPVLFARIRAEEKLLRIHFGAQYDAYCARTSRLIPGLY